MRNIEEQQVKIKVSKLDFDEVMRRALTIRVKKKDKKKESKGAKAK